MSEATTYGPSGRTERKTKAASVATFVGSTVLLSVLATVDTDMINQLPDWLEVPAYSLIVSAVAWLTGHQTRHRPGSMSRSAVEAVSRSTAAGIRAARSGR